MRITIVDPPAYTPPYDHALCTALADKGCEVELATSRFRHGAVPLARNYLRNECFYGIGAGRRVIKAAAHPYYMLKLAARLRRSANDVVHFQWLPLPQLDLRLISRFRRPRLLTAHDLPRGSGPWSSRLADTRSLGRLMDAVVVHSEDGRRRLVEDAGLPAEKVRVIPHGAFAHLAALPAEQPLDAGTGDLDGRKVVLFFGLLRPHKGLDVLIDAFASAPADAVLLIVGKPAMPLDALRHRTQQLGLENRIRWVSRFVADAELPAYFRRADLVVLPYREVEQSGVLATALAFGRPLLVTAVGGFTELADEHGAARVVPPGDARALGSALAELLGDRGRRDALAERAREAAAGPYSWTRAAELTIDLYRELIEQSR
jgi:glycosyltransferase involved in cell wall biosynthesis